VGHTALSLESTEVEESIDMSLVGPGTLTEYDGGPSRGRRQRGSVRVQEPPFGYSKLCIFTIRRRSFTARCFWHCPVSSDSSSLVQVLMSCVESLVEQTRMLHASSPRFVLSFFLLPKQNPAFTFDMDELRSTQFSYATSMIKLVGSCAL
jgi:hypothetical protein